MNIPGYTIIRELGSGGMATVYLARQDRLSREVALKVMKPLATGGGDFTTRFVKEGQIIAQLQHPQIVTIYDFDSADGYHYFSMEYLPGGTLGDEIKAGLPAARAIAITKKVAEALSVAHARGVIHRDVKPQNILFRADGTPVLTDFGIARAVKTDPESMQLTSYGMVIGSPRYMSPEQSTGQPLDARSDLYSLGVVFYEMLTNQLPYEADDAVSLAMKHCSDPIPELPSHLARYQPILDRLIAKKPDDRFASAGQLIRALDTLEPGATTATNSVDETRVVTRQRPKRTGKPAAAEQKRSALLPLIIVAIVALISIGAYVALNPPSVGPGESITDRLPPEQADRSPTAVRYEGLAIDHFQRSQFEQSLEIAKLGLSLTPDDARLLAMKSLITARIEAERQREEARTLLRENQLDESLAIVKAALREIPNDQDLLAMQTEIEDRLKARKTREADQLLENARADLEQDKLAEAGDKIERGLELVPDHEGLLQAQADLQAALAKRRTLAETIRQATDLLAAGSARACLDLVDRALQDTPSNPQLLELKATAQKQLQRERERELARRLDEARSQRDRGEFSKALETVAQGLQQAPDNESFRVLRAEILAAQAESKAQQANALLAQANAAVARNDEDQALKLIGQGLTLAPNHPGLLGLRAQIESARDTAAWIEQQLADCANRTQGSALPEGAAKDVAACYAAVLKVDPDNQRAKDRLQSLVDGLVGLIQATLAEHQLDRAEKALEELQAVSPNHPKRPALLADLERRRALSPPMTAVPGGCYDMGSPASETGREADERQHQVCVDAFTLAPVEVSVAAFATFVKASGYRTDAEKATGGMKGCWTLDAANGANPWRYQAWASWRKPNKGQANKDQDPVSCVSWNDAQAYLSWLNQETGGKYRLPTEAEWEHAARAGTTTARYWGEAADDQACRFANTADGGHGWSDGFPCNDGHEWVAPVGSYEANALGLKDMLGNLWEWTCSEYDAAYDGKETRCAASTSNGPRILRGGGWNSAPGATRSAYRNRNFPESRYSFIGFRVAEDAPAPSADRNGSR